MRCSKENYKKLKKGVKVYINYPSSPGIWKVNFVDQLGRVYIHEPVFPSGYECSISSSIYNIEQIEFIPKNGEIIKSVFVDTEDGTITIELPDYLACLVTHYFYEKKRIADGRKY